MIFLDTNILIEYLKGNKSLIKSYSLNELFISDIVVMELYQGAKSKQDLKFIINEIAVFKILKTNNEIIKLATLLVKEYNLSHNLKMMDAIIASTAMVYNIPLMTLNLKDFRYIYELELVTIT
ncbi:type II toxin-antitoxin system VapC family toxin [Candidatus Marithrix sp. Canyon 246]|uniref:type II toxin-antitoxin system VapC family toxin n=1 Tax=Candidatus Marithrix sp. Canyon 246 TaxID=1827136 RepID=UPI00084A293F|nr:type II toxin-antitoxin system VapC family toxin [Candidatus Marithrix sp. Canyon 246]